jgi:mono/diheme cytochrome c family protein
MLNIRTMSQDRANRIERKGRNLKLVMIGLCLLFIAGCRYDMQDMPRYEPYEESEIFKDNLSGRQLVEGTIPRGFLREDSLLYTGKAEGNQDTRNTERNQASSATGTPNQQATGQSSGGTNAQNNQTNTGNNQASGKDLFPFPVTREVIERGQDRFNIYCALCHGKGGDADGMIVQRGFRKPPSFHEQRLKESDASHYFDVITNGFGVMPSYAAQVSPHDRWAIIAYIRALQLSRENVPTQQQQPMNQPANTESHNQSGGQH